MSNGVLEAAAVSLGADALKAIANALTEGRSVICEISNNTDLTLTKTGDHHAHGGFATPPDVVIAPHTASGFGSQSVGGSIGTGTEGSVTSSETEAELLKAYPQLEKNECKQSCVPACAPTRFSADARLSAHMHTL